MSDALSDISRMVHCKRKIRCSHVGPMDIHLAPQGLHHIKKEWRGEEHQPNTKTGGEEVIEEGYGKKIKEV